MAENDKFIKNENEWGRKRNRDSSSSNGRGAKKNCCNDKTHEICVSCVLDFALILLSNAQNAKQLCVSVGE